MSLQVWLPMTKDLRQQGLSNVTVVNNGATFNSSGKLGGCYQFGTAASGIEIPKTSMTSFSEASVSFWVKILSWNTSYCTLFQAGTSSRNWVDYIFGVLRNGASSTLCFTIGNTSSTTTNACLTSTLNLNEWYHMTFTYKSGKMKIYLNGNLDKEYTTSYVPTFNKITKISLGQANDSQYQSNCLMNDVRIYDHCLSPMEVKRISQGLVLHYPLNRMGFGQENLLKGTDTLAITNNINTGVGGWDGISTLVSTTDGIKLAGRSGAPCIGLPLNPTGSINNNEAYTLSFEYRSNIRKTAWTFYYIESSGSNISISITTPIEISTTEWKKFSTTITNSTVADRIPKAILMFYSFSSSDSDWIEIKRNSLKLEKGSVTTPWCPNSSDALATTMGLNGTTEYDTSGYCNNGTKNNSPTYSSDTAKYEVSTHLDGNNQTIQLPNLTTLIPDSIFTFNIWFKRLEAEPSPRPWETLLGGPSGFEIETCSANNVHDNKIKAYSWGGGTIEFEFDKWNMLTMVSNGTNALFYLNGELKLTGTYKALVSGNYFIGSWSNTSTQNYKGYVCDARIYATALSATDVKSLYQNSAYIDSSGNVYGAVYSEV